MDIEGRSGVSKNLRQRAGVVVAAFRLDQGVQLRFVASTTYMFSVIKRFTRGIFGT
jgi:hypothetical protein